MFELLWVRYISHRSLFEQSCSKETPLQVEVLIEMAAQSQARQGNMNLYTPLTAVEAVK